MSSQALPVSDAVDCIVAVAILAQHIASRLVKLRRADTRTHHVEHRLLCFDHSTERALGIFVGLADKKRSFKLGMVSIDRRLAHVDDHISSFQPAARGKYMWHDRALHTGGRDARGG